MYEKAKKFPGAYLNLGSEYCISLPFLAQKYRKNRESNIKRRRKRNYTDELFSEF